MPIKSVVYSSLAINLACFLIILLIKGFLPPVVPLFYGLPSGSEQLSPTNGLFILPAAGVGITFLNLLIAGNVKDVYLKKALIISSVFVSILSAITIVKIILLVGFF